MKSKILIIDDASYIRKLMHIYFENAGFVAVTAADGEEGLHLAKTEKPDAIITDLDMPKIDGLTMIKQLRAEPETASIPIVVCTANTAIPTEELVEAGANNTHYKPIEFTALIEMIRAILTPPDHPAYE